MDEVVKLKEAFADLEETEEERQARLAARAAADEERMERQRKQNEYNEAWAAYDEATKRSSTARDGVEGHRCTGHCCESFTLPYSPEEMKEKYRAWLMRGKDHETLKMAAQTPEDKFSRFASVPEDIHIIYPMLIYIGKMEPSKSAKLLTVINDEPTHIYTCKHYDRESRKCSIYEFRPRMCQDYPYNRKCNYEACTWETEKSPKLSNELIEKLKDREHVVQKQRARD
jgi:Fe-S-cluster containining protein